MADLTTLANVKAWLSITTNGEDAVLQSLITSVSKYIENWLNRTILSATYTEYRDGTGTNRIMLANQPVTAVSSVVMNNLGVPAVAIPASTAMSFGYVFDARNIKLVGFGAKFPMGMNNVVVTYTAGYATVPVDIERACLELVALRFRERSRIGENSKSIGGETVSYNVKDFPDSVRTLLNQYRKVATIP